MAWRDTTSAVRLTGAALVLAGIVASAQPVSAQDYERQLAGIYLNRTAKSVLALYGNPNEIIIGEVGVRAPVQGGGAGVAGGPGGGFPGAPGGFGGRGEDDGGFPGAPGGFGGAPGGFGGGPAAFGGGPAAAGGPAAFGGAPGGFGGGPAAFGGGPSAAGGPAAFGGAPGGFGGGPASSSGPPGGFGSSYGAASGGGRGFGGAPGGFGGRGGFGGADEGGFPGGGGGFGGPGGGIGQFGQTISTLARQQEVTWIYNRKIGDNLVSYEFLIGPDGNVVQIRVSGYSGGRATTRRGVTLGDTYKEVVQKYGYPEEHYQVGRVLVASYRNKAHVQFQFLNEQPNANPMSAGNKVVAITIATVE
ncbi:MAG: hypothetical protein OHK0029_31580 [Armatimonadaceae bacterium]